MKQNHWNFGLGTWCQDLLFQAWVLISQTEQWLPQLVGYLFCKSIPQVFISMKSTTQVNMVTDSVLPKPIWYQTLVNANLKQNNIKFCWSEAGQAWRLSPCPRDRLVTPGRNSRPFSITLNPSTPMLLTLHAIIMLSREHAASRTYTAITLLMVACFNPVMLVMASMLQTHSSMHYWNTNKGK